MRATPAAGHAPRRMHAHTCTSWENAHHPEAGRSRALRAEMNPGCCSVCRSPSCRGRHICAVDSVLCWGCFFPFILRFYLFLERGKEEERNIHVWLPLKRPLLGTWPATQACALTGNQTCDPLVCRPAALSPLRHTSQGCSVFYDRKEAHTSSAC